MRHLPPPPQKKKSIKHSATWGSYFRNTNFTQSPSNLLDATKISEQSELIRSLMYLGNFLVRILDHFWFRLYPLVPPYSYLPITFSANVSSPFIYIYVYICDEEQEKKCTRLTTQCICFFFFSICRQIRCNGLRIGGTKMVCQRKLW